jgi:hypothetical protein
MVLQIRGSVGLSIGAQATEKAGIKPGSRSAQGLAKNAGYMNSRACHSSTTHPIHLMAFIRKNFKRTSPLAQIRMWDQVWSSFGL